MIIEAIGWMAIIWVLNSFARMSIKYMPRMERYFCLKCWTFWGTLAITWNPITAAIAALIAALVDTHLNNTNITL